MEKDVFANSLLGTTIQDSGTSKRKISNLLHRAQGQSVVATLLLCTFRQKQHGKGKIKGREKKINKGNKRKSNQCSNIISKTREK